MVQALLPALTDLKELKDHSTHTVHPTHTDLKGPRDHPAHLVHRDHMDHNRPKDLPTHTLHPALMDLRMQKDLSDRVLLLALTAQILHPAHTDLRRPEDHSDQTLRRTPMDPRRPKDLPVHTLHPAHTDLRMQKDLSARVLLHPHMDQPLLRLQLNRKVATAEIFLLQTSVTTRTSLARLLEDLAMVTYQEATWVATRQIEASVVAMAVLPLMAVSVATAVVLFPVELTEVDSRLLHWEDIAPISSRLRQRVHMVAATIAELHRAST